MLFVVLAVPTFNRYKRNIETNAINHYVVGDTTLVEKTVNGDVVDWYYVVEPVDYE